MANDEVTSILQGVAHNGDIDYTKWPVVLDSLLTRLDSIVYNTFPIPTIPPQHSQFIRSTTQSTVDGDGATQSQIIPSQVADPTNSSSQPDKTLPGQLQALYDSLKATLSSVFWKKPPYTVQRLAELLLFPDKHYRTLPAFLRAVDRVVLVSSTADVFPLPFVALETNGVLGSGQDDFNGAALEPIPWAMGQGYPRDSMEMMGIEDGSSDLRIEFTAMIDGPNGAGSVETVTVGTNGESANGIDTDTNSSTSATDNSLPSTEPSEISREEDNAEEKPHARGPEEIGMEDMGPQAASSVTNEPGPADSIQVAERAVGRPGEGERVVEGGEKPSRDVEPMVTTEDEQKTSETNEPKA